MNPQHLGARCALPLGLLALCAASASAQTLISGNVSDSSTGALLSGQVYLTTSSITIPSGQTLTIQPGAILKVGEADLVNVSGELIAPGGAVSSITSFADDSVGGDSNGDGPSAGAPQDWAGIRVQPGGRLELNDVDVRFCGASVYCPIYMQGGEAVLDDCIISDSDGPGIRGSESSSLSVRNSHIQNCVDFPIQNVPITDLPNFSNNTASGNGLGDVIRCLSFNLDEDVSIVADNLISGVLAIPATSSVEFGATLTLGPNLGVKWIGASLLDVEGNLVVQGAPGQETVFTSFEDDSFFGDSNVDGFSQASKADWAGIRVLGTGHIEFHHAILRAAGASVYCPVYCSGGDLELYDCVLEFSDGPGIDFNGLDVVAIVERTDIRDTNGWAIHDCLIEVVPGFSQNTASGNLLGDAIRLDSKNPARDATIIPDNLIDSVLVNASTKSIEDGVTVEFQGGVIVKNDGGELWNVLGSLFLRGTDQNEVIFTSLEDDQFGGDTKNDGPTVGVKADWAGLRILGGGLLEADHTRIRFAGASVYSGFYLSGGLLHARDCTVEQSDGPGVDFNNTAELSTVVGCHFEGNNGLPINDVRLDVLEGCDSNTAANNVAGDYIRIVPGNISANAVTTARNLIGGSLFVPASTTVLEGTTWTLEQGVSVKFNSGSLLTVTGTLRARGTVAHPVSLSSFDDDTFGGDTNGDGPSTGAPGDWAGIRTVANNATNGILDLEQTWVRYGGASVYANIVAFGDGHNLRAVRSEHCSDEGFRFDTCNSATVVNCIASNNQTYGFDIEDGAVDVLYATVTGSPTGIRTTGLHAGSVRSSIAWGNTVDFDLAGSTQVTFCTGANVPAGTGNSLLDPQWIDGANGDYRLAIGSPAVDAADSGAAVGIVRDALDASRLLAPSGLGGLAADQGAFEQSRWSLSMDGSQAIGETLTFQVDGESGVAYVAYSPNLFPILLEPFGVLQIGPAEIFQLALVPTGVPALAKIPASESLVGFEFGVQGVAVRASDPNQAQFTNLQRVRVESALP